MEPRTIGWLISEFGTKAIVVTVALLAGSEAVRFVLHTFGALRHAFGG